ncbi:hypothetical protein CMV_030473 [Castanea mollissima]|uniref:Protein kinase domain-containing protein n=1 Tax=Castanea mollissima TaxID=60419 RepID=A0A8J4Q6G8_9ROSI|nr:hypothetical protein CMV_030473 [Castanea mollissima]
MPVERSLPSIGSRKPFLYSMEELADMTDNFSEKNLIGETLFTKLFGIILYNPTWLASVHREEVMFLTQPSAKQHPNVVNLLGYSDRRYLEAVVYDLNPLDTVHNLATTGSLTWLQRIKVALGFARALEFLHDPKKPYLVRNINAAHIILDQDCNPKIFDFSTMSGGILGKLTHLKEKLLTVGYDDPESFPLGGPEEGGFEYRPNHYLVHESLVEDPGFHASDGIMITELAMRCIQRELDKRPTMKDVVKHLEGLQAVQLYGNVVGM